MRLKVATAGLLLSGLVLVPSAMATTEGLGPDLARRPMAFEINQGQTDPEVKFLARGRGYTLFLTSTQCVLSLQQTSLRMDLGGANPQPEMESLGPLESKANYLMGNDPKQWRTGIQTYRKIRYREVYPGIDLVYYGQQGQLEFDFVLQPGAVPDAIRLHFDGAEQLHLDAAGGLVVGVGGKSVRWPKPLVYQFVHGAKKEIEGDYVLKDRQQVAFRLGSYDPGSPLVIDPVLVYSTYLGGNDLDGAAALALDRNGNVYLTGQTLSLNFPTHTPYHAASGSSDVFVSKLNSNGTALVYSTYLGGNGDDYGAGIAVDTNGNAYVTGETFSPNFPTANAFQSSLGGSAGASDAFLVKLGPGGSNLLYSTYFGGPDIEYGNAIALDSTGNAYLTGATMSGSQFPRQNPFQNNAGGHLDAFVAKFNPATSGNASLIYSSWLGGGDDEQGNAIAVDTSGNVYVAGEVFSLASDLSSSSFPVLNAAQPLYGGGNVDAFVAKINAVGSMPIFATFLGGDDDDSAFGIALDSSNNVYVTGQTRSDNYPTTLNAFQPGIGGGFVGTLDAFVTKLPSTGASLLYSTYLGGESEDSGAAIAVDGSGQVYVTGWTDSDFDFPITTGADQSTYAYGTSDAFVAKLNPAVPGPSAMVYCTYWGGGGNDFGNGDVGTGIAVDTNFNFYVCGTSDSVDLFTTTGAFQRTFGGGSSDAFVVKFGSTNDMSVSIVASPNPVPVGSNLTYSVQVNNNGRTTFTGVFLTNILPGSVQFVSLTATRMTCANAGGTIVCNVGTLTNNASASATFTVKTTTPTNLTDTAILVSNQSEPNTDNNNVSLDTVVRGFADLAIGQSAMPDPVFVNSNLTYTISVTNNGPGTAYSSIDNPQILVTTVLPQTLNLIGTSQDLPGDSYLGDTTNVVIFEMFADLPPNAVAHFTVIVSPYTAGTLTNQVSVGAFELDLNPANNSSKITTRANAPPTISSIANQTGNEDSTIGPISFTIGDSTTPVNNLAVSASSSNLNLVSNSSFTYGGTGANRNLSIVALANQSGTATITVSVTDGDGAITSTSFMLTVNPVNDRPTLDPIPNLTLVTNSVAQPVNLSGISSGATNEIQTLTVNATSSQPGLIPNPTVTYTSPNSTGTLVVTHSPNATGTATITVTVQDNGGTANGGSNTLSRTFLATVNASPALRIGRTNNNNSLVLLWPTNAPGFHLESRTNLSNPTNWITVTNPTGITGDQTIVTNSAPNGNIFFRLRNL